MPFFRPTLFFRTTLLLLGPLSVLGASSETDLTKDTFFSWLLPMLSSLNQSNSCYKDLLKVAWGLFHLEEWALNMLDAGGKPEANLLGGNFGWVGSYPQCIGIKRGLIEGQHCWINNLMGICLPKSCKNIDLKSFALSIDCEYTSHFRFSMTSYIAVGICCILLLFVVWGTLMDVKNSTRLRSNSITRKKDDDRQLGNANRLLRWEIFSLLSNCRSLFSVEQQKRGAFPELNGLKGIKMAIIIYFHSYSHLQFITKNPWEYLQHRSQWYSQPFVQFYLLSTFFLITGFLTLYSVLRKPPRGNKLRFLFTYVINRYLKMLVAPFTIVFIFYVALLPLSSSGPLWRHPDTTATFQRHWWQNALFITNWWPEGEKCFGTWWFLTSAVQLHFLSLVVIVPLLFHSHWICVLNGSALLVGSWGWIAWKDVLVPLYPQHNEFSQMTTFYNEFNWFNMSVYQNTFLFSGPYVVGMGLAWVFFQHKDGISLNKKQVFCGWLASLLLFYLTMYAIYLRPNRMLRRVHLMFANTIYGLSIAWLILICNTTGSNGRIIFVLRWKYWLPVSKLTLCAYLLNEVVIDYFYMSEVDKIVFSGSLLWFFFIRNWIATYLVAIVAALTIEMPLSAIVDAIFR